MTECYRCSELNKHSMNKRVRRFKWLFQGEWVTCYLCNKCYEHEKRYCISKGIKIIEDNEKVIFT